MLVHAAAKTLAFFGAGEMLSRYETRDADGVRGVIRVAPFTGVMVLLGALAITGVPPFGIFRSELLIVTGGFSQSKFALAGLLIVFANVAFVGVYQLFHRMVISPGDGTVDRSDAAQPARAAPDGRGDAREPDGRAGPRPVDPRAARTGSCTRPPP